MCRRNAKHNACQSRPGPRRRCARDRGHPRRGRRRAPARLRVAIRAAQPCTCVRPTWPSACAARTSCRPSAVWTTPTSSSRCWSRASPAPSTICARCPWPLAPEAARCPCPRSPRCVRPQRIARSASGGPEARPCCSRWRACRREHAGRGGPRSRCPGRARSWPAEGRPYRGGLRPGRAGSRVDPIGARRDPRRHRALHRRHHHLPRRCARWPRGFARRTAYARHDLPGRGAAPEPEPDVARRPRGRDRPRDRRRDRRRRGDRSPHRGGDARRRCGRGGHEDAVRRGRRDHPDDRHRLSAARRLEGVVGRFFLSLATTLCAAVLLSLVVALLVVPLAAARFLRDRPPARRPRREWVLYPRLVRAFVRRPLVGLALALALAAGGAVCGYLVPTGFLPAMDEGAFVLDHFLPAGTSLGDTDLAARRIEAALRATPEVLTYSRRTGAELGPAGHLRGPRHGHGLWHGGGAGGAARAVQARALRAARPCRCRCRSWVRS